MLTLGTILLVAGTFLVAGLVKGTVGMGLPIVALALLTPTLGIKLAVTVMVIPAFFSNVWQALAGEWLGPLFRRLWPFLLLTLAGTWLGTGVLARVEGDGLTIVVGAILVLYAAISLATPQIPAPGVHERWLSPLIGGATGLVFGATGTSMIPGVLYVQALGLRRDELVQALGVFFTILAIGLGSSLTARGLLDRQTALLALSGLPTAFVGMHVGARLRRRVPEASFRRLFFAVLAVLGAYIALAPLIGQGGPP